MSVREPAVAGRFYPGTPAEVAADVEALFREAGPTSDQAMQPYYVLTLTHAEEQKDVQTFEAALKVLKDKFGKVEAAQGFFTEKEKKLAELKEPKK